MSWSEINAVPTAATNEKDVLKVYDLFKSQLGKQVLDILKTKFATHTVDLTNPYVTYLLQGQCKVIKFIEKQLDVGPSINRMDD